MNELTMKIIENEETLKAVENINYKSLKFTLKEKLNAKINSIKEEQKEAKFNIFSKSINAKLNYRGIKDDYKNKAKLIKNEYDEKISTIKNKKNVVNGSDVSYSKLITETQRLYSLAKVIETFPEEYRKKDDFDSKSIENDLIRFKQERSQMRLEDTDKELIKYYKKLCYSKLLVLKNKYFWAPNCKKEELKQIYQTQLQLDHQKYLEKKIEIKQKLISAKQEYKDQLKLAKDENKAARTYLEKENIYVNSYGEAVSETSGYQEVWEARDRFLFEVNEHDAKTHYGKLLIKEQNELKQLKSVSSFDNAVKYITMIHKIKAFKEIVDKHKEIDSNIQDHKNALSQCKTIDKSSIFQKKVELKQKYIEDVKAIQHIPNLTNEARKNLKSELSFKYKLAKREVYLNDTHNSLKEALRFAYIDKRVQTQKILKIMWSTIDDEVRKIPTKAFKNSRWVAAVLSFLIPGVGQIINKEYTKGILFLLGTIFIYALALPQFLGLYHTSQGAGIFGLIDLSPILRKFSIGGGSTQITYFDARFRMVEGIIAIFLVIISLLIMFASAHDARRTGFYREFGYRPSNKRDMKKFLSGTGLPLVISLPAFVLILFIVILPLVTTVLIAFTNYSSLHLPPYKSLDWIGFDNFISVFSSGYGDSFAYVTGWTIIWTLSVTIGTIFFGTILALIVDNPRLKGKKMWSMIFILPWAVPAFATILFFASAFMQSHYYQDFFGTETEFVQSVFYSRMLIIVLQIWLGHSYVFMLVMGIKKGISDDLYEAASIDGAKNYQVFSRITGPLILQQVAPLLIGQFIFNFNNFGIIYMFTGGGPNGPAGLPGTPGATDIIISLIFKLSTQSDNQVALASAFTIVMSVFIVILATISFLKTKSFKKED